ncbi:hypothetical protein D3C72_1722910 [compost metagenome]
MEISAASLEIVVVPWRMLPPLAFIVAAIRPLALLSAISPAISPSACCAASAASSARSGKLKERLPDGRNCCENCSCPFRIFRPTATCSSGIAVPFSVCTTSALASIFCRSRLPLAVSFA